MLLGARGYCPPHPRKNFKSKMIQLVSLFCLIRISIGIFRPTKSDSFLTLLVPAATDLQLCGWLRG